jgi:hypothetical protein
VSEITSATKNDVFGFDIDLRNREKVYELADRIKKEVCVHFCAGMIVVESIQNSVNLSVRKNQST